MNAEFTAAVTDPQLTLPQALELAAGLVAEGNPQLNATQVRVMMTRSIDRMQASAATKARLKEGLRMMGARLRVNKRMAAAWRAAQGTEKVRTAAGRTGHFFRVNKHIKRGLLGVQERKLQQQHNALQQTKANAMYKAEHERAQKYVTGRLQTLTSNLKREQNILKQALARFETVQARVDSEKAKVTEWGAKTNTALWNHYKGTGARRTSIGAQMKALTNQRNALRYKKRGA